MEEKELTKNETKEKMIKNCKTLKKVIKVFEYFFIGFIIFIAIMVVLSSIATIIEDKSAIYGEKGEKFVRFIHNFESVFKNAVDAEEQGGFIFGKSIVSFSGGIIGLMILDCLSKILKNVIEKETPFTKESIKYMKEICILVTIMWALSTRALLNFGLIFVLAMWILQYIFKYGYQLQIESDETL